ncbi:hypothetical protein DM460_20005 [Brevibacillus laterosporus]|nr:hypothetical protein DM460_20005 [Brevibacillus laterosporus]
MDFDYFKWTNYTGEGKSFYVNFDTYQNRSLDYFISELDIAGGSANRFIKTLDVKCGMFICLLMCISKQKLLPRMQYVLTRM